MSDPIAEYNDCKQAERLWRVSCALGQRYQHDGKLAKLAVAMSNTRALHTEWMDALERALTT